MKDINQILTILGSMSELPNDNNLFNYFHILRCFKIIFIHWPEDNHRSMSATTMVANGASCCFQQPYEHSKQ